MRASDAPLDLDAYFATPEDMRMAFAMLKSNDFVPDEIEKLNELDTTGVEPLRHMSQVMNVMRNDELQGSTARETALANAPIHDGTFIKVPKVISK